MDSVLRSIELLGLREADDPLFSMWPLERLLM